jgi:hypothetical protein
LKQEKVINKHFFKSKRLLLHSCVEGYISFTLPQLTWLLCPNRIGWKFVETRVFKIDKPLK